MFPKPDLRFSIARIECNKQRGTGFLVSSEGHVLTCAHVIDNPRNTKIYFYDEIEGFSLEFSVIEVDSCSQEEGDFCLLKIKGQLPIHLIPLSLFKPPQSAGHDFISFGFPDSKPFQGLEGKGKIQTLNTTSEMGFPIIQLDESNSITQGFSGSPLFDMQIGGVIGIIHEGIIDTRNFRQLETSFSVPIDFVALKCQEAYQLKVIDPQFALELPRGFSYLKPPKSEKIAAAKIKYQDFLQSNNLPYISRNDFKSKNTFSGTFMTETFIIDKLLNSDFYEGGIVFGEGGIGKTRLMLEIGQMALNMGWSVIKVHPEANAIEDLLRHMTPQYKYLLLFDYIEESKCFNSDIVSKLNSEREDLTIRVLANCRYTYQASSNFPEAFLQIELKDNEVETHYQAYVTQSITHEIIQKLAIRNQNFFDIKPSFAVFLKFLLYKEQLETDDIREVGDFKTWIKKRFRLTFGVDDFAKLDKKIVYLLSILPLQDKTIDELYKTGFKEDIQKLKNDGWIEEVENTNTPVLKAIHDTIVDELLIIHLENVRKDVKREVSSLLDFAIQYQMPINWLRSFERIVEQPILSEKRYFYQILNDSILRVADNIQPIKYAIGTTPLLIEEARIDLIAAHTEFFREYIENLFFAKSLSFALNKEKLKKGKEASYKKIFSIWYSKNTHFIQNFSVSYRILSTYLKYFGIDDFVKLNIKTFFKYHGLRRESSFVIQAWFDNKGDLKSVEDYVIKYLEKNSKTEESSFVFQPLLERGFDFSILKKYLLDYLKKYAELKNSAFHLASWVKAGGNVFEIENYMLRYLEINAIFGESSFILQKLLIEQKFSISKINKYIKIFLEVNINLDTTSYILYSWLKRVDNIAESEKYVINFLNIRIEDIESQKIIATWINRGGDLDVVKDFVSNFLVFHARKYEAQYVISGWLKKKGDRNRIEPYLKAYLKANAHKQNTGYVYVSWLNAGGNPELIRKYIDIWMQEKQPEPIAKMVETLIIKES